MSRLDAGKSEQALEELSWFVEKFPDLLEARIQLARVYVKLGRAGDAVTTIEGALANHADNANIQNVAGAIYLAMGDVASARDHLNLASTIDPDLILPKLNLARLDRLEGNVAASEVQYRSLLETHPYHVESGLELARILLEQEEFSEASERVARVLERKPALFEAHALKLELLLKQRESKDRIRTATYELHKKFGSEPRAAFIAGKIYAALGDKEDAKLQFRHAVQEAQFDGAVLTAVAEQQIAIRDRSGALWTLTKALQGNPNDLDAAALKVEVLIQLDNLDSAAALIDDMTTRHGEVTQVRIRRGDLRVAQDRIGEAITLYADAYEMAPSSMTVRMLFSALVLHERTDDALGLMQTWLRKNERDYPARNIYAETLMRLRRYREARREYEVLLNDGIENVVVLNNLAMIYQHIGDKRARQTAELAFELEPEAWSGARHLWLDPGGERSPRGRSGLSARNLCTFLNEPGGALPHRRHIDEARQNT